MKCQFLLHVAFTEFFTINSYNSMYTLYAGINIVFIRIRFSSNLLNTGLKISEILLKGRNTQINNHASDTHTESPYLL